MRPGGREGGRKKQRVSGIHVTRTGSGVRANLPPQVKVEGTHPFQSHT